MSTTESLAQAQRASKNDLRSFIAGDSFKAQVALALPAHMTPDRFARVALTALTKTPKLLDCTRESLLRCLMDCSQLGLEPDGRHAHLIPYKDTCTLIIDYKGLMALARRSGEVAIFRAELVKDADEFDWQNGTVTHVINWRKDRGKTNCVYSYVKFKDGAEDWEVMTLEEVRDIMERSQGYKSAKQYNKSHPWLTDFDEMAKKTVIRRHSKRLTLSPEFTEALDKDDGRIEERPAKGREVADLPPLFAPAPAPAIEAPAQSPREAFWDKCEAAGMDMVKVMEILIANQFTDAEFPSDLEEAAAAEMLKHQQWETLCNLYAKGGAK